MHNLAYSDNRFFTVLLHDMKLLKWNEECYILYNSGQKEFLCEVFPNDSY